MDTLSNELLHLILSVCAQSQESYAKKNQHVQRFRRVSKTFRAVCWDWRFFDSFALSTVRGDLTTELDFADTWFSTPPTSNVRCLKLSCVVGSEDVNGLEARDVQNFNKFFQRYHGTLSHLSIDLLGGHPWHPEGAYLVLKPITSLTYPRIRGRLFSSPAK